LDIRDVSWLGIYFLVVAIITLYQIFKVKYWQAKEPDRHAYFRIHSEPSLNYTAEPIPRGRYIAHFHTSSGNERFTFVMRNQLFNLRFRIEGIHERIIDNNNKADAIQYHLENNPNTTNAGFLDERYERYMRHIRKDMCSIRKLESVYLYHDRNYTRKPQYPGEEM
jgi:hypothetical protein